MSIKKLLGQKIKQLRKELNLSQEKFSELIDLNPRQVVRIENGESFPTAENLEKIAAALEISPQDLFISDNLQDENIIKEIIFKKIKRLKGKKLKALYNIIINL